MATWIFIGMSIQATCVAVLTHLNLIIVTPEQQFGAAIIFLVIAGLFTVLDWGNER